MANNLGFVWMFLLDASVLNWLEYQYNKEIEMDKNTNSFVWLCTELAHESCLDDKLWNCIVTLT